MQTRFLNHLDPLTSFEANAEFVGLFEPGRYRGFDVFVQSGPLAGGLRHIGTGTRKTLIDNATQSAQQGLNVTRQGVFVFEDAEVPIAGFNSNAANAFDRIDLIIMEHEWLASLGGQAAIYSVIQGADGGPVVPDFTATPKQTAVGQMLIPASDANLNNAIYTPATILGLGGTNSAYLDQPQEFIRPQGFGFSALDYASRYTAASGTLDVQGGTGNNYSISLLTTDDLDTLTSVLFPFTKGSTVRLKITQTGTAGFITETGNITLPAHYTTIGISSGSIYEFFTEDGTTWALVGISDAVPTSITKVVDIGAWNMDATPQIAIAHGLTAAQFAKVRRVDVLIQDDDELTRSPLNSSFDQNVIQGGVEFISSVNVQMERLTGGLFDSTAYNDVSGAPAFNRGWISITYEL